MEIEVSTENGRVPVTVLHIEGNIDSSTYPEFESQADGLIDNGSRYMLVDLENCGFISSAGFRALNHIYRKLRSLHPDVNLTDEGMKKGISAGTSKSQQLKLLNLSPEIRNAFELSGFNLYIETYDDLKTAVASF